MTDKQIRDQQAMEEFCATGSEPAFAELVQRHRPRVTWYYEKLGRTDAADLAHSVIRLIAQHRDKFEPGRCAYGWLFSIATRLLHNRERAEAADAKREAVERRLAKLCG